MPAAPVSEKRSLTTPESPIQTFCESLPADNASALLSGVHAVLQNKGGIGKTIVSMNLIQYLRDHRKQTVHAIDLDPMNHTLAEYSGLQAKTVDLLTARHADLNGREIDSLAASMLTDAASFVIDNGAAGFTRFGGYLAETEFAEMLAEHGRVLVLHVVIAGGDMAKQCILGLNTVLTSFPASVRVVVWLNEFAGPVEIDGMKFEEMAIYRDTVNRFAGLVRMPALSSLFLQDFNEMLRRRLTYAEAIEAPDFNIMNRQRLIMIRRQIWQQLDQIL